MKRSLRILSIFLVIIMVCSVVFTSCNNEPNNESSSDNADTSGDEGVSSPKEEYFEPLVDGYNQITFYWSHSDTYENCDVWAWWDGKDGKGYVFHECEYGAKAVINVPEGVTEVGFIVRKNCSDPGGTSWGSATKDFEQDRFAVIEGRETFVYLKSGVADQFKSEDGGKTLTMLKEFSLAGIVDEKLIEYRISPKASFSDLDQIKVYDGDREIKVVGISTLGKESSTGKIEVEESLDLSGNYRVVIEGYGEKAVVPTGIFDSEYFAEKYYYDGDDLGAVIDGGSTTFKVWAPTASSVVLNLFEAGDGVDAYKNVEMTKGDYGVWSHTEQCGHGTYYTYSVTTSVGTQEAVDPYAKAAGLNGNRGMVVDLSLTDPEGWKSDSFTAGIESYSDAIIWEVHVRDFSNKIESSQYKGKYLAFTESGLVNESGVPVGVDYLKQLGISHVHLLPVYDYATVDESSPEDEFNWGYDPKNYNVPEGSYSTNPYDGAVRINEFKQMVMALHEAGIGVIMDVVYNHTYDANSSFNRIVPYYYYRYTSTGANSSASGCGNDTASERYMFGKFMVDSTSYLIDEYDLDGFRFDLMGLHDLATMQKVESAVHTINPEAIIYGEGWTMGATIDGSAQANQSHISQIVPTGDAIGGIAVFNDATRDGLKGSVFDKTARGYISGSSKATASKILFGIRGGIGVGQGWTVSDSMVINYMSAHDNNTLWDKLILSNPDNSDDERNRMNNLGAAIIMVSRGTPFWQAGEEMLRTKDGDENSYKSSDEINNINWDSLAEGTREYSTMLYYKGLIEMRKAYKIFSQSDVEITHSEFADGALAVTIDDKNGGRALLLINPINTDLTYNLDEEWNLIADREHAGTDVIAVESGKVSLPAIGIKIYVNDAIANVN
ncbi:MAG: type I pullulanase [Ruminococcaceae bacterium]|nr:type I pullulanase [Oscillospiraceae bacterium]